MAKKQNNKSLANNSLNYLKMILKRLSLPFEKQYFEIEDFAKYNLVNDILSDWDNCELVVQSLIDLKLIDKEIAMKFFQLIENFDKNNQKYVWSLDALKNDPFWEQQRQLAKHLLDELEKIQL